MDATRRIEQHLDGSSCSIGYIMPYFGFYKQFRNLSIVSHSNARFNIIINTRHDYTLIL